MFGDCDRMLNGCCFGGSAVFSVNRELISELKTLFAGHDPSWIFEPKTLVALEEKLAPDPDLLEKIKRKTEYKYPYSSLAGIMAKVSPSDLETTEFSTEYFASEKPQFLSKSGMNPANRGTATHKFMEFFDYSAESFNVDAQIERMVAEHHLTEDEAKILERGILPCFA